MRLSEHFILKELESRDGASTPLEALENLKKLTSYLEIIRKALGNQPLHIASGYRSRQHNKRVGGVRNSYHTKGMAADLVSRIHSPKVVYKTILKLIKQGKIPQGGVGLYRSFVHYDFRGYKARWKG